jgi:hypothetical protein
MGLQDFDILHLAETCLNSLLTCQNPKAFGLEFEIFSVRTLIFRESQSGIMNAAA